LALAFSWLLRKGKKFKGGQLKNRVLAPSYNNFIMMYECLEKQEDEELVGNPFLWG